MATTYRVPQLESGQDALRLFCMVSFICNICGAANQTQEFVTEPASCACGSNVRVRALIHLLSAELFGKMLILADFPQVKGIRGLGMTDKECYAKLLADKFDYVNTYYDREPRFDFTDYHAELAGTYDFILSADVLEHVAPPVERVLDEVHRLLKPCGFFVATIPCNLVDQMHEHFPELFDYRVVFLKDSVVLVNRRRDGNLEVSDKLVFHSGSGSTLEMREFGITGLRAKLLSTGFREIHFLADNLPEIGILFDSDVSQPLVARKLPFVMDLAARSQIASLWRNAEDLAWNERERADMLAMKIRLASKSRWLRLGRKFGFGPDFT